MSDKGIPPPTFYGTVFYNSMCWIINILHQVL
jgi:hypothetical protein